ncbi:zinc carboxypeptidase [Chitinophaga skermanii]|uniref:Zinc carboxypeptidase n=1 Tax=Chitinophaga skermanii TaxID=331697 RepID=A0A327QL41_9BACT|nr:M14 metallopeptidase family protein [Chitinophaga skermanii]RAJ05259.1 zinc carboxypeptidase [Chitinophaga skermanii]
MRSFLLTILTCLCLFAHAQTSSVPSPAQFLGYELGARFTPHYKVLAYFEKVAATAPNVKILQYGTTYENRPLIVAMISSPENFSKLEDIRTNNLKLTQGSGNPQQPAIVWLSYNVHGNESVSTEASMKTLYQLLQPSSAEWLKNTVVIIDPCLNPDGRERYVNFYNANVGKQYDATRFSREHREPWPGGRPNHYYFDLNRDWAWQSQVESQQRVALYNQWLPQIHVDFHEQGIDNPYYFAPAAEPFHDVITPWQREFQTTIGKNNAKYFDAKGWLYFTREQFDLFYPSYGDTYPLYNGAIGMTYEQGGSGSAGLAVLKRDGDTLTLTERIAHHYTTGLSTVEATSAHAAKVVEQFQAFYKNAKSNPASPYKTYVIKEQGNRERLASLAKLLKNNNIEFGYGANVSAANGFNYFTNKTENFTIEKEDIVINAYQPHSTMLSVLFEPTSRLTDSVTYDITAWALPYAYGIQSYAVKASINPANAEPPAKAAATSASATNYAYLAPWNSVEDVKFLAALLNKGFKVRYSEIAFSANNRQYPAGTLIITRSGNTDFGDFDGQVKAIAAKMKVDLDPIASGMVDKGADFGSGKIRFIKQPKVGLVSGSGISSLGFGEVWHYFDQQLDYPITILNANDVNSTTLRQLDVLILVDGYYSFLNDKGGEFVKDWVNGGGKIVAIEDAAAQMAGGDWGFKLKKEEEKKEKENPYESLKSYEDRERESVKSYVPGAIYKVNLDNTHPLAFGYGNTYFTLKQTDKLYEFLPSGWNVGTIKKDNYLSGFVGVDLKARLKDGLLMGVREMGNGEVVFFADNPIFRSFWESGKLMLSNAVFMVGQ